MIPGGRELEKQGYIVWVSTPCVYRHSQEDATAWRHGDDIILEGEEEFVVHLFEELKKVMILKKTAMLGCASHHDRWIFIPIRIGRKT